MSADTIDIERMTLIKWIVEQYKAIEENTLSVEKRDLFLQMVNNKYKDNELLQEAFNIFQYEKYIKNSK